MKISTKGRYGLRILLDLALHGSDTPRLIRDIAESQQISEKYISRLIIDLRRAGLVKSIRGSKGGYRLSCDPRTLSILDIVEVMEGPLSMVDCLAAPDQCHRQADCAARTIWHRLNENVRQCLAEVRLQDIIDKQLQKNDETGFSDYCI